MSLPFDDDLFWEKVNFTDDCWLWTASTNECGYGMLTRGGQGHRAHRYSYIMTYRETPEVVRHICDIPACVRPTHLIGGSVRDNVEDMLSRKRHWAHNYTSDDLVEEIKKRLENGEKGIDLAEEYGLATSTISRYKNGRRRA